MPQDIKRKRRRKKTLIECTAVHQQTSKKEKEKKDFNNIPLREIIFQKYQFSLFMDSLFPSLTTQRISFFF
jgi:hypothetical protein